MKFTLNIDPTVPEEVTVTAHAPSPLTRGLEALVLGSRSPDRLTAYLEDDVVLLEYSDVVCITVQNGKTHAVDTEGRYYRLKQRLCELEACIPPGFIRINKSALANEQHILRFSAAFSGAIDAVFKGGFREYVSRRCFAAIRRRYNV